MMTTEYTHTHVLKPTWSRVMHRMQTLGNVIQTFRNTSALLSREGNYPTLITTPSEDYTSSLDGNQLWQLNTWQNGIVKVNPKLKRAQFIFTAITGEIFHTITLTPKSHWDCFECLVSLFSSSQIQHNIELSSPTQALKGLKINQQIAHLSKVINRQIIQGKQLIYTLPLAGGSSNIKNIEAKTLMTQFGRVALKDDNAHLQLDPTNVTKIEIDQNRKKFQSIIYNQHSEQMLSIEAV